MEAEIEDWEDPEQSMLLLKKQVAEFLGEHAEIETLKEQQSRLRGSLRRLERQNQTALNLLLKFRDKFEAGKQFLKHHGIDLSDKFPEIPEIPIPTPTQVAEMTVIFASEL